MKKLISKILAICVAAILVTVNLGSVLASATAESAQVEATLETLAAETQTDTALAETVATETAAVTQTEEPAAQAETTADSTATDDSAATSGSTDSDTGTATDAGSTDTATDTSGTATDSGTTGDSTVTDGTTTTTTDQTTKTGTSSGVTTGSQVDATDPVDTADEEDVGSGPAWIMEGAHRHYGSLYDLLPIAAINNLTVVLCTKSVITLNGYSVDELRNVSFAMDTGALEGFCDGKSIIISAISPEGKSEENKSYLWIGYASDVPSAADQLADAVDIADDDDVLETEVMVASQDYLADAACTPTFTLTAYPELSEGMTFAVILDDAAAQAITGNTYAPTASGEYRFAVLDASGQLIGRSMAYTVSYPGDETATDETATGETTTDTTVTDETLTDETVTQEVTQEAETLTETDLLQEVSLKEALTAAAEIELLVRTYDYAEGTVSNVTPTFTLSGAPSDGGYYYGISINDGKVVAMRSDTFAETDSGEYTYTFYILNKDGEIIDTSSQYHVILDYSLANYNSEAWMEVNGAKMYGSVASLLRQAGSGAKIYLLTSSVIAITNTSALESVSVVPDPELYGSDYGVVTSSNSPDGESAEGVTYLWLGVDVQEDEIAPIDTVAGVTFSVDSVNIGSRTLASGLWVNGSDSVSFAITDTNLTPAYYYEISLDGGVTFENFSAGGTLGSLTTALVNGNSYNLVFRVTDQADVTNTVTTGVYTVSYDNQKPILICKAGSDNTLVFFAGDSVSGFSKTDQNVTFNAGSSSVTWSAILSYRGQHVYVYSVQYKGSGTIAAGTLGVRDQAGNMAVWGKDIVIVAEQSNETAAVTTAAKSSGGSSTSSRTVYHSASTYTTVTAYNGVELVVETGEMDTLTIGDQQLDLTLALDGSTDADATPTFQADFIDWKKVASTDTQDTDDTEDTVDTLVLTASDSTQTDGAYLWTFDGSVYKKLSASGIDYMVFNVGDQVAALSTAGFTAGVRYNMYRAAGLASKSFIYTVRMTKEGTLEMQVTVDGDTYTLSNDQTSEFYYYDVYCGTMDMLNNPFGQESVQGTAAQDQQG